MKTNYKTSILIAMLAIFGLSEMVEAQTITDADGNTYNTIIIGSQKWMKENLKTTKYLDFTSIPTTSVAAQDISATPIPSVYQWAYSGSAANKATYGLLYTFDAAAGTPPSMMLPKKICPAGWHLPTKIEWDTLISNLGGGGIAGGKLKETGTTYWNAPNTGATNSSSFSALGAGQKWSDGSFVGMMTTTHFWTSTQYDNAYSWAVIIGNTYASVSLSNTEGARRKGKSVRCICDIAVSTGINERSQSSNLIVYPNPSNGKFNISYSGDRKIIKIEVYTITGELILEQTDSGEMDLSAYSEGIYFARIHTGTEILNQKIIVKK